MEIEYKVENEEDIMGSDNSSNSNYDDTRSESDSAFSDEDSTKEEPDDGNPVNKIIFFFAKIVTTQESPFVARATTTASSHR